jgi:hypothetical protein
VKFFAVKKFAERGSPSAPLGEAFAERVSGFTERLVR